MGHARRGAPGVSLALLIAACGPGPSPSATLPAVGPTSAASPGPSSVAPSNPTGVNLRPLAGSIADATYAGLVPTTDGFVAFGQASTDDAAVFATGSSAGDAWQLLDAQAAFGGPFEGFAVGSRGWVAAQAVEVTGGAGVGTRLWRSGDGMAWQAVPDQAGLGVAFPGPLTAGGWGFAMAGQAVDASGTSGPAVWTSVDGRAWHLAAADSDWLPDRVVVLNGALVAMESSSGRTAISQDGTTWSEPAPGPSNSGAGAGFGGPLLGVAHDRVVALTSDDTGIAIQIGVLGPGGVSWQAIGPADQFAGTGASALATSGGDAIVLGYDRRSLEPRTWVSSTGLDWHRLSPSDATFGGGVPGLVAVGSRAFVALGWYASEGGDVRARPWSSTDGLAWSRAETDVLGQLPDPPFEACPAATPTTAAELLAMATAYPSMPRAAWPLCFGDRELSIEGYVQGCGGCGGASAYTGSPGWLLDPLGYAAFWLTDQAVALASGGVGLLGVQVDPRHPVTIPGEGTHVRITGHFDDPAADACRLVPTPGAIVPLPPAARTTAICRQQLVATRIEVLKG